MTTTSFKSAAVVGNEGDLHQETVARFKLSTFCKKVAVDIIPGLEARVSEDGGIGICSSKKVTKGQRVMHVPTVALYTIETADYAAESWAATKQGRSSPVHAILAAHLTFGPFGDIMWENQLWQLMWPRLSTFTTSMPMFWPDRCKTPISLRTVVTEAGKISHRASEDAFAILPPPLTGAWLQQSREEQPAPSGSTSLISHQYKKFLTHLGLIMMLLPQQMKSLSDSHDTNYWDFVHKWCCVNTRCFYYVAPWEKKPKDPNEAMAMCPGMDMFNHTDKPGCKTTYDRSGFSANADRDYKAGEEILLSYGAHNNDVLWAEYGFLLDENQHDAIRIDRLVLDDLDDDQKDLLAEYGYLGEFWLQKDGVCYLTEVAAKTTVLSRRAWIHMVQEGADPTELIETKPQVKRKAGGTEVAVLRAAAFRKVKSKQVEWVLKAKAEADSSLRGLNAMSAQMVLDIFADDNEVLKAQGVTEADIETARSKQSSQRQTMCLKRWRQIWEMCVSALRSIEGDCAGSFMTGEPGRTQMDLDATIEHIMS